jgi:hypothetical protein
MANKDGTKQISIVLWNNKPKSSTRKIIKVNFIKILHSNSYTYTFKWNWMLGINEVSENQESTKLGRISSTQGCINSENGQ